MNLRYLFKWTLPLALPALLSWGCTGDFERLNTNPYEVNPDDLPFEAQFLEPMSYSYPDQQNLSSTGPTCTSTFSAVTSAVRTATSPRSATTSTGATAAACTRTSCCTS